MQIRNLIRNGNSGKRWGSNRSRDRSAIVIGPGRLMDCDAAVDNHMSVGREQGRSGGGCHTAARRIARRSRSASECAIHRTLHRRGYFRRRFFSDFGREEGGPIGDAKRRDWRDRRAVAVGAIGGLYRIGCDGMSYWRCVLLGTGLTVLARLAL